MKKTLTVFLFTLLLTNLFSVNLLKFWVVEEPMDNLDEMVKLRSPKLQKGDYLNLVFDLDNCKMKNNKASITYYYELKANMKTVYKSTPETLRPDMQNFWYLIEHELRTSPSNYEAIIYITDNNSGKKARRSLYFKLKKGSSRGFAKKRKRVVYEETKQAEIAVNHNNSQVSVEIPKIEKAKENSNKLLSLDKGEYFPNEEIKVTFKVLNSFTSSAWVGVLPDDCPHGLEKVNDENDISYKYLKYKKYEKGGTMILKAPKKKGSYDIRLNDSNDGREMAFVPFIVSVRSDKIALSTDKKTYFPNEEIKITYKVHPAFTSSAWIGVLPTDCPHGSEKVNDENDLSYKYLKYKKYLGGGDMILKAPKQSGTYDIRMHNSNDGYEVASVTIMVK